MQNSKLKCLVETANWTIIHPNRVSSSSLNASCKILRLSVPLVDFTVTSFLKKMDFASKKILKRVVFQLDKNINLRVIKIRQHLKDLRSKTDYIERFNISNSIFLTRGSYTKQRGSQKWLKVSGFHLCCVLFFGFNFIKKESNGMHERSEREIMKKQFKVLN